MPAEVCYHAEHTTFKKSKNAEQHLIFEALKGLLDAFGGADISIPGWDHDRLALKGQA